MADKENKVEIKGVKNPDKLESFDKALPSIFAMGSTKNLIKAAASGDVEKYPQYLNSYKWKGTRDYNMVLIILSPIVVAMVAVNMYTEEHNGELDEGHRNLGNLVERFYLI